MDTMPAIEAAAPQAAPQTSGGPLPVAVEVSGGLGGQAEAKGVSFGEKLARLAKTEAAQSDPDPESLGEGVPAALWVLPLFLAVNAQEPTGLLADPNGKGPSIFSKEVLATLAGIAEGSLIPNLNGESALAQVLREAKNGTSKEEPGAAHGLGAALPAPTLSSSAILASFPITGGVQNLATAGQELGDSLPTPTHSSPRILTPLPITGGVQTLSATSLQTPQDAGGAPTSLSAMTSLPAPAASSSGVQTSMTPGIGMNEGILAGSATPQANGNESVPRVALHIPVEANGESTLLAGEVRLDSLGAGTTRAIAGDPLTKVVEEAATFAQWDQAGHRSGDSIGSPGTHSHAAELLGKPAEPRVAPEATLAVPKVTPASFEPAPVGLSHGRETMQLLFEPADLGRVRMQVSILAHEVRATVSVQHQGLGEYLANSQGNLDDQLRQHGLRVEEFQVNTDPGRAGQGQDPTHFRERENSETLRRAEPAESPVLLHDAVAGELEPRTSLLRINTFA